MGFMDKFKKKDDDDLGDLSDLGDFGLDDKSGGMDDLGGPGGLDPMGDLPSPEVAPKPGMHAGVPTHMEEVQPSAASHEMGAQFGLDMTPSQSQPQQQPMHQSQPQQQSFQQQQYAPQQQTYTQPQYAPSGFDMNDLAKDMEIIHAKLDAIKSSLDSVNQRLATLERMAGGDSQPQRRYSW